MVRVIVLFKKRSFQLSDISGCKFDMNIYPKKDRTHMTTDTTTYATAKHMTENIGHGHELYMDNFYQSPDSTIWKTRKSTVAGRQSDPKERNARELCLLPTSCWFLAWLTLWPWKLREHIPKNVGALLLNYMAFYTRGYYFPSACCWFLAWLTFDTEDGGSLVL